MTDKKDPSKETDNWRDLLPDDDHTRSYQAGGAEEENEITPIEEISAPIPPQPAPKSQALMDIQEAGLTPGEAVRASEELAAQSTEGQAVNQKGKAAKKTATEPAPEAAGQGKSAARSGAENLAVVARFRWIFLLVLALISVTAWAAEAFLSDRLYRLEAGGWLVLTLLFSLGTINFLRLPTRSGLAALFWGGSYAISALYGPPETLFDNIPAALGWAGLLTLIVLWMGVAIWRKLGRYRVIDLLLTLVLIYAALAPVGALITSISSGAALSLTLADLGASPAFMTAHLPGLLWPMSVLVAVILPLCALFSLWDQFSAIRRRGGRHGGNLFLALAFVLLLPYAFLSFDQAVSEHPQLAKGLRSIWPAATQYARENKAPAPVMVPASPVTPPPAPAEVSEAVTSPEPNVSLPPSVQPVLTPPATPVQPAPSPPAAQTPAEADSAAAESSPPLPVWPPLSPTTPVYPTQVASPALPDLDKRIQSTDERLDQALTRIEELESEIKLLKQFRAGAEAPAPSAPPAVEKKLDPLPIEDFFKENNN